MIARLPDDVLRYALQDFLGCGMKELSCLDVACCSRKSRSAYLEVLPKLKQHSSSSAIASRHLGCHMEWILFRGANVIKLSADVNRLDEAPADLRMPQIEQLSLVQLNQKQITSQTHLIAPFLACFPNVKVVVCGGWFQITNQQLLEFRSLPASLQALDLKDCHHLSGITIVSVIGSLAGTLRKLSCDVLLDQDAAELAHHCRHLESLKLVCRNITNGANIEDLCRSNGQFLQELYLENDRIITEALVCNITRSCARLASITLVFALNVIELGSRMFTCIVASCPDIAFIKFVVAEFRFERRADGRKGCAAKLGVTQMKEFIRDVLVRSPIDLVSMTSMKPLDGDLLCRIADRHGDELEHVQFKSAGDINGADGVDTLLYFFNHCPALTDISVWCLSGAEAQFITFLPMHCPHVTSLELNGSKFCGDALLAVLANYQGNKMKSVSFNWVQGLDDAHLMQIAELFPDLEKLSLVNTAITKETMIDLILSRRLRARQIHCLYADWIADEIKARRFVPRPAFKGW